MTDTDEPTGADEPTRVSRPRSSGEPTRVARATNTGVPGNAASTTPGRRADGSIDPPDPPIWARKPVIIGVVVAVVVVALLAFFLLSDDGEKTAATGDKDSTSLSTTTSSPTSETTAPPSSEPTPTTPPPETDPEGTDSQTPTTALGTEICQAFNRLEEGFELVFNAGELSDADAVARSGQLADHIDESVGLFESLADRPYGADATTYAAFLEPFAGRFREATTRDAVDALGDDLLEPPIDIAEAATRLQDEWDAECG